MSTNQAVSGQEPVVAEQTVEKPPRKSPVAKVVQCVRCKRMRNSQAMRSHVADGARTYTCRRVVTVDGSEQCHIPAQKKSE
jgi:hypothetical protein